jgi:polyadenylation factor subunit 2
MHVYFTTQMMPPEAYPDVPSSSLTTQFAATTQNKTRCALHCARFSPDCRRMMTGDNAGGISVWSSTDFGYMQYLQVGLGD